MKLLTKKSSLFMAFAAVYCVGSVADAAAAGPEETAAPDSLSAMFTQAKIDATIKMLWFERDFDSDKTDMSTLAVGGNLLFETAPLHGLSGGVGFKTSQGDLLDDDDKNIYGGLLAPEADGDGDSYAALDEYYLRYNNWNTDVLFGAFSLETPWMKGFDIRMNPKKYRGLRVDNASLDNIKFHLSYITDWMDWAMDDWESVSSALTGEQGDDEGAIIGGVTWKATDSLVLQLWDNYYSEVLNHLYGKAGYTYKPNDMYTFGATLKYLDQTDVGDALAGETDTYMAGGDLSMAAMGAKLTLLYGQIGDDSLNDPFGGDYAILMQTKWIERAEEEAWGIKLDYDFTNLGVKGLSMYIFHSEFDTPDSGENVSTDMSETDFSILYKFSGWAEGLSAQFRYAHVDQDEDVADGNDWDDVRFYLTYRF